MSNRSALSLPSTSTSWLASWYQLASQLVDVLGSDNAERFDIVNGFQSGDSFTITINGKDYSHTVEDGDNKKTIRRSIMDNILADSEAVERVRVYEGSDIRTFINTNSFNCLRVSEDVVHDRSSDGLFVVTILNSMTVIFAVDCDCERITWLKAVNYVKSLCVITAEYVY